MNFSATERLEIFLDYYSNYNYFLLKVQNLFMDFYVSKFAHVKDTALFRINPKKISNILYIAEFDRSIKFDNLSDSFRTPSKKKFQLKRIQLY